MVFANNRMLSWVFLTALVPQAQAWGPKQVRSSKTPSSTRLSAKQERDGPKRRTTRLPEDSILDQGLIARQPHQDWIRQTFMPDAFQDLLDDLFDDGIVACIGDDCEECEIPESYKVIASQSDINVMEYLDIRRVDPIKRPT